MLKPTEKIWHNGRFIDWNDAKIHVLAHVTSYGSSVFEGIRCYATPSGPAIFRVREHIRRLLDSAKIYRIEVKHTIDQLAAAMSELVRMNKLESCYFRPLVLRGYGDVGVLPFANPVETTSPAGNGASIWVKKRWLKAWTCASPVGRASRPIPCPRSPRPARTT